MRRDILLGGLVGFFVGNLALRISLFWIMSKFHFTSLPKNLHIFIIMIDLLFIVAGMGIAWKMKGRKKK